VNPRQVDVEGGHAWPRRPRRHVARQVGAAATELRRVVVRRDPPVRVLVTRPADGEEWSGLLHGWAHDVADDRGLRALVTYRREHPPDDWADVVAWVLPEHVRRV
jgi:hypothetical protein